MKIHPDLIWDDENLKHLWQSHQVTPDEVEEILLGIPGEEPIYRKRRDGEYLICYGETGGGRLLKIVGELCGERFRVFAARDMEQVEKRAYRKRK